MHGHFWGNWKNSDKLEFVWVLFTLLHTTWHTRVLQAEFDYPLVLTYYVQGFFRPWGYKHQIKQV